MSVSVLLLLSIVWGISMALTVPNIPCPGLFQYVQENGIIYGQIHVSNDNTRKYQLIVNFSVATILQNQRVRITLLSSADELQFGGNLRYRIEFPAQHVIPRLTQIVLNGNLLCSGPSEPVTSLGVTNLWAISNVALNQQSVDVLQNGQDPLQIINQLTNQHSGNAFDGFVPSTDFSFFPDKTSVRNQIPTQNQVPIQNQIPVGDQYSFQNGISPQDQFPFQNNLATSIQIPTRNQVPMQNQIPSQNQIAAQNQFALYNNNIPIPSRTSIQNEIPQFFSENQRPTPDKIYPGNQIPVQNTPFQNQITTQNQRLLRNQFFPQNQVQAGRPYSYSSEQKQQYTPVISASGFPPGYTVSNQLPDTAIYQVDIPQNSPPGVQSVNVQKVPVGNQISAVNQRPPSSQFIFEDTSPPPNQVQFTTQKAPPPWINNVPFISGQGGGSQSAPFISTNAGYQNQPTSSSALAFDNFVNQQASKEGDQCGVTTQTNQYPWLVAILQYFTDTFKYKCTGNLISRKHVLSAAHCFVSETSKIQADDFSCVLGKLNITSWSLDSTKKDVVKIHIHDSYKQYSSDYDLAILALDSEVAFADNIRPLCLWQESDSFDIFGKSGTAIGWKINKDSEETSAQRESMNIIENEDCLRSDVAYLNITSKRTFCAGGQNTGPCVLDSGAGLVMQRNGKWTIRGIIARGPQSDGEPVCDRGKYVVFADCKSYLPWIRRVISR